MRKKINENEQAPAMSSVGQNVTKALDKTPGLDAKLNKIIEKFPLLIQAKELLINNLIKFETKQKGFANEALEISIQNSYQGVFEPKKNSYNNNFTNNDRPSFLDTYQHILNK